MEVIFVVPEELLFRPARGGKVSKGHLMERLDLFSSGQWAQLIAHGSQISQEVAFVHDEDVGRLVQIWNVGLQGLNNWRHCENYQRAGRRWRRRNRSNMRTLAALIDPSKRPHEPRGPLNEDLLTHQPVVRTQWT